VSKQVKLRRGTTAEQAVFTGAEGELTYDEELVALILHDGLNPGGTYAPTILKDTVTNTLYRVTVTNGVLGVTPV
jgi:hypothetical protein